MHVLYTMKALLTDCCKRTALLKAAFTKLCFSQLPYKLRIFTEIPVNGQLQLRAPFSSPKGVRL